MVGKIFSCTFSGLSCTIIEVQADISRGMPRFLIVGLGDTSVQESKERVRASIKNSGVDFPAVRKTVNLAPAYIKKKGASFDFPIAVSLLVADGKINNEKLKNSILIGELSLNGILKSVDGIIAITQFAVEMGYESIYLPSKNVIEASYINDIKIYPVNSLKNFIDHITNIKSIEPAENTKIKIKNENLVNFDGILGLEKAKRGLLIAAVGGHNVLLHGSPGCGKTILARAFKKLLPRMDRHEILETSKIFSIAGFTDEEMPLVTERPFREVHHSASVVSVVGGGVFPKPGEISLAHNGVLFFDEIAEFSRQTLEALRQPLEDKQIVINRINMSLKFPSNFIFIATMNPCPCGFNGDKYIKCTCTQRQIINYKKKVSGPILDRFDIFIEVVKSDISGLFEDSNHKDLSLKNEINNAIDMQTSRFEKHDNIGKNADMGIHMIKQFCKLDSQSKNMLDTACNEMRFSNRVYLKLLKIARTIADIDGYEFIQKKHIAESIQYRNSHL